MTSPSVSTAETKGPWEGGFAGPGFSDLGGGGVIIASQLPEAGTGILVSYSGGIFTSRFWTTGPLVPQIIEILPPEEIKAIGDQVAEQLRSPGNGLDDIPLRAFLETVRLYLETEASDLFAEAVFGSIAQVNPAELQGEVSWPGDVVGTVLGADGVSGQTHLAQVPAGHPAPLRQADLRSFIFALENTLPTQAIDPLWQQMLSVAERACAVRGQV
jgi:hypothetical protein